MSVEWFDSWIQIFIFSRIVNDPYQCCLLLSYFCLSNILWSLSDHLSRRWMITIGWNYPNVCWFGKISIKIVYLREEHFTWRGFDRHCSDAVQSFLFVMIYSFNIITLSARSLGHEDKISQFVWRRIWMPLSKQPLVTLSSNVSNLRSPNVSALKASVLSTEFEMST